LKHRERFAIRSKNLTLDPTHNKYISSFANIRIIQKYLVSKAEKLLIPCIDNTNVDRSVAAIHSVIIRCMRHLAAGQSLFDPTSNRAILMHEELKQSQQDAWSSKRMQQVIKMKVEKKELFHRLFAQSQSSTQRDATAGHHHHDVSSIILGQPLTSSPIASRLLPSSTSLGASAHASLTHSPLPRSPLLESRTPTTTHEYLLDAAEHSALGGDRSRSMSVSYRRASVSALGRDMPQEEDGSFDLFGSGSPNIASRSMRENETPSTMMMQFTASGHPSAAVTAESTPIASPLPSSFSLSTLQLPAAVVARAVHRSHARATLNEVDSEDDTPLASEVSSDTEDATSQSSQAHRRHMHRIDTVSQLTPSLYSYDDHDAVGVTAEIDDEHDEQDLNMDLTILQEEDEDEEEAEEAPVDEDEQLDAEQEEDRRRFEAVHLVQPAR
jgi:hypothetical protein